LDRLAKIDCTVNGWPVWRTGMRQPVGDGAGLDDVAGERQLYPCAESARYRSFTLRRSKPDALALLD
jgi:hypothetical protein